MKAIDRRLAALERTAPLEALAPHLKQWLGIALTPEEQEEADHYVIDWDWDEVDWSEYSPEVREWLGR